MSPYSRIIGFILGVLFLGKIIIITNNNNNNKRKKKQQKKNKNKNDTHVWLHGKIWKLFLSADKFWTLSSEILLSSKQLPLVKGTDSLLPTFRSTAPTTYVSRKKRMLETKNNTTRTTKIPNSWLIHNSYYYYYYAHNIKLTSQEGQGQLHIPINWYTKTHINIRPRRRIPTITLRWKANKRNDLN